MQDTKMQDVKLEGGMVFKHFQCNFMSMHGD